MTYLTFIFPFVMMMIIRIVRIVGNHETITWIWFSLSLFLFLSLSLSLSVSLCLSFSVNALFQLQKLTCSLLTLLIYPNLQTWEFKNKVISFIFFKWYKRKLFVSKTPHVLHVYGVKLLKNENQTNKNW